MSPRPWKLQWSGLCIDKRPAWHFMASFRTRESAERKKARAERAWGELYLFRVVLREPKIHPPGGDQR